LHHIDANGEVDVEKTNELIRSARENIRRAEYEATGHHSAFDIQQLAIGEDTYDLALSEEYLGLIKVKRLRSDQLRKRWEKSQNAPGRFLTKVEWAGQTFEVPLEHFDDVGDAQGAPAQAPSRALAFVKSVPPKAERRASHVEEASSPRRPVPAFRVQVEEGVVEFRTAQTREGGVYLYLL
jgi:hypothetical protein